MDDIMFCVFCYRPDKWTYTGENFEKSFTLIGQNIMSSIKWCYVPNINGLVFMIKDKTISEIVV